MQRRRTSNKARSRRGSVTVEFALVAPILMVLTLGVAESSRLLDVQSQLATAARQGARLAAMDRSDLLADGQSTNDKITSDIRNFMDASGLSGDSVDVSIADPDNADVPFDLDSPANEMKLFQLRVTLPLSPSVSLSSRVVFRNAQSVVVN